MSSAQVMPINNELKRKPVALLDNMNTKQIKLDKNRFAPTSSLNTTFENYIPNYTPYDNTPNEKLNSSNISEYISNHFLHSSLNINNTRFVTQPPAPVAVEYCETCNHVLQHCKGCLDNTKLCGNPHCGNRQKGTTFCVACKGLDEYHPICRSCVEYPPYLAQTNQCAHCNGYFCAASLSNPSLKYKCERCDCMVCWRCRTQCNKPVTEEAESNLLPEEEETTNTTTKASVNIDILMKNSFTYYYYYYYTYSYNKKLFFFLH
ncbi:hypothetical protein PIROE2DRAFT_19261 [Piromyces sp. E2]|nr:hypothetical protein PIROE2DRAFT_19261 [Piromyces sp. E2]|eukprot:OUM56223.1 hypothetical protein PIROE2DRAFT_19261 [Piromyces sp. E2]